MQTNFLCTAASQLDFFDVIKTPGLPLSVSDDIFHIELYLCIYSKKGKSKLRSAQVNDN